MADAALLLRWRNEPYTRAMSMSTGEVALTDHERWLERKLGDASCELWIGEHEGVPVGQVRFDTIEPGVVEVSISVDRDRRGAGLGLLLLESAIARRELAATRLRALVRAENEVSLRLFSLAGFAQTDRSGAAIVLERPA